MAHYIALLHREEDAYSVLFPDFPGCVSTGDSYEDALRMGAEALAFHVAGMQEDGELVPEPRSLEQIKIADDDWIEWNDALVTLIPLLPPPEISERVNVTLPKRLLAQIDAVSRNRSGFLAQAAAEALRQQGS
ncbi:type II toxin-antitoxin system HicB family antitoxin [Halomonas sp. PR-M31]|uniref:type II toxin-antitoxin system HicB family antitoxin n=1 Tax=Halomonas sp. PR-M31 TaxID=1471202 RepID=UPI000651D95A|nr:type II toxin-antitoxin system HicB family antitoxin [Halomonas sp. PR-M31]